MALVALGLGVAELAMLQTRQGIFQQLPALSAQARASVPHLTFMASLPSVASLAASAVAFLSASPAAHFAASLPAVVLTSPQFDHVSDCSFLPIDSIHLRPLLLIFFPSTKAR